MDRRVVLLIILMFALIAAGIYNFYYYRGRHKAPSGFVVHTQKPATTTRRIDRNPEKPIEKAKKFYLPEGWGRNPFLTPAEIKQIQASKNLAPEDESEPARPLPEYVVTSILISGAQKVAVIDGKIVSLGDTIGKEIVKEISPDGVELAMEGNLRMIKLRQSRVKIKVKTP